MDKEIQGLRNQLAKAQETVRMIDIVLVVFCHIRHLFLEFWLLFSRLVSMLQNIIMIKDQNDFILDQDGR